MAVMYVWFPLSLQGMEDLRPNAGRRKLFVVTVPFGEDGGEDRCYAHSLSVH